MNVTIKQLANRYLLLAPTTRPYFIILFTMAESHQPASTSASPNTLATQLENITVSSTRSEFLGEPFGDGLEHAKNAFIGYARTKICSLHPEGSGVRVLFNWSTHNPRPMSGEGIEALRAELFDGEETLHVKSSSIAINLLIRRASLSEPDLSNVIQCQNPTWTSSGVKTIPVLALDFDKVSESDIYAMSDSVRIFRALDLT